MKVEAMEVQGKRTDLTSSQVATKSDTAATIGQQSGESRDQVYRYIRLTYLIPELLKMVDERRIALIRRLNFRICLKENNEFCMKKLSMQTIIKLLENWQKKQERNARGE